MLKHNIFCIKGYALQATPKNGNNQDDFSEDPNNFKDDTKRDQSKLQKREKGSRKHALDMLKRASDNKPLKEDWL